jgi:hypothetical protein
LKKKSILIIAAFVILILINVTFAVLYLTRDVNITGGVSVNGDMQVYDDDGVTVLTSFDFTNFTGGVSEEKEQVFFINNTGNQPLYVYWNISASSLPIDWNIDTYYYRYYEDYSYLKYTFAIDNVTDFWIPESDAREIPVGESIQEIFSLWYSGNPVTAETFSMTVTFYARDA